MSEIPHEWTLLFFRISTSGPVGPEKREQNNPTLSGFPRYVGTGLGRVSVSMAARSSHSLFFGVHCGSVQQDSKPLLSGSKHVLTVGRMAQGAWKQVQLLLLVF